MSNVSTSSAVSLCSLLGYEEFYRRHWFYKAASWIDDRGCVMENLNFENNRSAIVVKTKYSDDPKKAKQFLQKRMKVVYDECHIHPMALILIFMANGIRHALHFMKDVIL